VFSTGMLPRRCSVKFLFSNMFFLTKQWRIEAVRFSVKFSGGVGFVPYQGAFPSTELSARE
jgi:hypothetical protein